MRTRSFAPAFSALLLLSLPVVASAAPPDTLQIEGVLTATGGGAAADGDYQMTFALYEVAQGGVAAWKEGPTKVAVKAGRFVHVLGSTTKLSDDVLSKLKGAWLGMEVAANPELPRIKLHSVLWALQARSLACSGCVTSDHIAAGTVSADKIGFTYAGAKTKGGPANAAMSLQCTGCVHVKMLNIDQDLLLGGNSLKAKELTATTVKAGTVIAQSYVGDGSKLTGIQTASGECKKAGEVIKGIAPDGTLICVAAMDPAGLPADGLDEISNGLLTNQYVDNAASSNVPVPIPDNNPKGVEDTLIFPDIGIAQSLKVHLHLVNSDIKNVTVTLTDPNNASYTLYLKNGSGKVLQTSYPTPTKPVKGDLSTWIGQNPKGKWKLKVVDSAFVNNTTDGEIVSWSVSIQTLSTKKVTSKGLLITDGGLLLQQSDAPPVTCTPKLFGYLYANPKAQAIYVCNGKQFVPFSLVAPGSQFSPAESCKKIKELKPNAVSGVFWIDPDGSTGPEKPFATYCDQVTNGGGWTLTIKGTLKGSYNASLDQDLSASKGFMRSFNRLRFKDVMVKMGDYKTSNDWAAYYGVGNGSQTLDHRIKNCCSGSYGVNYNQDAPFKVSARSASLSKVAEVEALSLRMSQTAGPNDAMFFVLTRKTRAACNNYTSSSYRYVSNSYVGAQLGFGVGKYNWSSWTTWTGWQTGCGYAGYWAGATNKCQSAGAVFVR